MEEAQEIKQLAMSAIRKDFDPSASAVQAYFKAAEQERTSIGLAEYLLKVHNMKNDELNKTILELTSRLDADVVEGEVKEEKSEG